MKCVREGVCLGGCGCSKEGVKAGGSKVFGTVLNSLDTHYNTSHSSVFHQQEFWGVTDAPRERGTGGGGKTVIGTARVAHFVF